MTEMIDGITPTHHAMLQGLDAMVRDRLRKRFEPIAKECIDAAIDEAMETFSVSIQQKYSDPASLAPVVEVLLTDKREKLADKREKGA